MKLIGNVKTVVKEEYERGYVDAIKKFIEDPLEFHTAVRMLYKGDIALFETPCIDCGKPMVFTHKSSKWVSEIKPALLDAFRYWHHKKCK